MRGFSLPPRLVLISRTRDRTRRTNLVLPLLPNSLPTCLYEERGLIMLL
jgi:hypothetical protein